MTRCRACNSILREYEYQGRSADEAHNSAQMCPECPLKIEDFSRQTKLSHTHLPKLKRSRTKLPIIDASSSNYVYQLCVTTNKDILRGRQIVDVARCSRCVDAENNLFRAYSTGLWENQAIYEESSVDVGPDALLIKTKLIPLVFGDTDSYIDFKYLNLDGYIARERGDKVIIVYIIESSEPHDIAAALETIYLQGAQPQVLTRYFNNMTLGTMSNLSARAYDAAYADEKLYKFSIKPDGERMWMSRIGLVWIFSKRLLGHKIEAWIVDESISELDFSTRGPILDIEFMLGQNPILIDVLMQYNGCVSSPKRTIDSIAADFSNLVRKFPILSMVYKRPFKETLQEAILLRDLLPYPTDGLVAVSRAGTDMLKLKSIRSIELELDDNGTLKTSDSKQLFKISSDCVYSIGSIIELRISVVNDKVTIHETFERYDKVSANDSQAVKNVLAACIESKSENITRNSIWRWSNDLRRAIYSRAYSMISDKNIILDIGSGSGQSSEAFDKTMKCSYILVEPDEEKCKLLAKRLKTRSIDKNPRSFISIIPQLKRGSTKYHILNAPLDKILSDAVVVRNLSSIIGCAIASFSTQFVADSLRQFITMKIPFIGCYYSYDGINIGESIINTDGLQMKRKTDTTATVKWGRDTRYDEPIINKKSLPEGLIYIGGSELVELPEEEMSIHAIQACSQVIVLISI